MKRFHNIYLSLATIGIMAGLSACSDDIKAPDNNPEGITGITLMIPNTEGATQFAKTRSDDALSRGADDAAKEGAIKELWLLAYGESNTLITPITVSESTVTPAYKSVNVTLSPDTYKFYVVANVNEYIGSTKVTENISEEDLNDLFMNFSEAKPLSLEKGLPMACRNTEIKVGAENATSGELATDGKVEISAGECPKIFADMTFLCSKVRFTLLHDRADFSSAFGESEFDVTGAEVSGIADKTNWNYASSNDYSNKFDLTLAAPVEKVYPANVTKLESEGEELNALTSTKNLKGEKRAWQQTIYLPENLSSTASDKSKLTISTSTNGVESAYALVLNEQNVNGSKLLERGRFYDITIKAKSRDVYDLSNFTVHEWTNENIVADFTHTFLNLSQTENIEVKSLEPFTLGYLTDGTGGVKFECKSKIGTEKIINVKSNSNNSLILEINSAINVAKVPEGDRNGEAEIEICAGNIKKILKVKYDITPFFTISPTERTIGFAKGAENRTEFEYATNLGGFTLRLLSEQSTHNVGYTFSQGSESNLSKLETAYGGSSSPAVGRLLMTETTVDGPSTSVVYYFVAEPKDFPDDEPEENYRRYLTVTVQPKMDDYRIYFRAINDYFITQNGANETGKQLEFLQPVGYVLPSEEEEPWKDFWNENGARSNNNGHLSNKNPGPEISRHRVYIYNQKGNNNDWSKVGENVIYFNKFDDTPENNGMTPDYNNLGWYYRDLKYNQVGTAHDKATTIKDDARMQIPQRGETLLIFHNHLWSDGIQGDYMAHRVATSNEPGVPLFSYADNIGWYLYDPTRDPVFNCYDDKPIIEDVEYIVYSDQQINGWERSYGKWRDQQNWTITIHAENWKDKDNKYQKNQTTVINGKTYYVNHLWFKAPRGEYDKAIELIFSNGKRSVIFKGGMYPNNTGTYENGEWRAGDPN